MGALKKRFIILVFVSATASALLGLFARSPAELLAGAIVLGLGMTLGILYYLLRPLPFVNRPFEPEDGRPFQPGPPRPTLDSAADSQSVTNVVQLSVIRRDDN